MHENRTRNYFVLYCLKCRSQNSFLTSAKVPVITVWKFRALLTEHTRLEPEIARDRPVENGSSDLIYLLTKWVKYTKYQFASN